MKFAAVHVLTYGEESKDQQMDQPNLVTSTVPFRKKTKNNLINQIQYFFQSHSAITSLPNEVSMKEADGERAWGTIFTHSEKRLQIEVLPKMRSGSKRNWQLKCL